MPAESRRYRYKNIEFWASKGRIFMVDVEAAGNSAADLDDQIKTISPGEFMKRAIAIRIGVDERYQDEVFAARQLLERAKEVCKIAWHFGDPTDMRVLAHLSRHRTKRPRIVVDLPSLSNYKLPKLGDPRMALLNGKGVEAIPDFTTNASQMLTPARAEKLRKRRS